MLIADIGTARAYVDVERRYTRKVYYNARGAIGRDVISVLHYSKAHCLVVLIAASINDTVLTGSIWSE